LPVLSQDKRSRPEGRPGQAGAHSGAAPERKGGLIQCNLFLKL
jgi:hypothetical protein